MKLQLDTNAYVAMKRGVPAVIETIRTAKQLQLSAVVVGELFFGFHNGTRFEENQRELNAFMSMPQVEFLVVDEVTSDRFGRIATSLRGKGKPIPTNDIWIAAHAMAEGAVLLSADKHFLHVDGLIVQSFT